MKEREEFITAFVNHLSTTFGINKADINVAAILPGSMNIDRKVVEILLVVQLE